MRWKKKLQNLHPIRVAWAGSAGSARALGCRRLGDPLDFERGSSRGLGEKGHLVKLMDWIHNGWRRRRLERDKGRAGAYLVVHARLFLSGVDDILDAGDGQRGLGNIGRHHDQAGNICRGLPLKNLRRATRAS